MFGQVGAHLDYIFTDNLPRQWLYPGYPGPGGFVKRSIHDTIPMYPLIRDSKWHGKVSIGCGGGAIVGLALCILGFNSIYPLTRYLTIAALLTSLYQGYKYKQTMGELFTKFKCELTPGAVKPGPDSITFGFFTMMAS